MMQSASQKSFERLHQKSPLNQPSTSNCSYSNIAITSQKSLRKKAKDQTKAEKQTKKQPNSGLIKPLQLQKMQQELMKKAAGVRSLGISHRDRDRDQTAASNEENCPSLINIQVPALSSNLSMIEPQQEDDRATTAIFAEPKGVAMTSRPQRQDRKGDDLLHAANNLMQVHQIQRAIAHHHQSLSSIVNQKKQKTGAKSRVNFEENMAANCRKSIDDASNVKNMKSQRSEVVVPDEQRKKTRNRSKQRPSSKNQKLIKRPHTSMEILDKELGSIKDMIKSSRNVKKHKESKQQKKETESRFRQAASKKAEFQDNLKSIGALEMYQDEKGGARGLKTDRSSKRERSKGIYQAILDKLQKQKQDRSKELQSAAQSGAPPDRDRDAPPDAPGDSEESPESSISEERLVQIIDDCRHGFANRATERQNYLKQRPWLQNMKKQVSDTEKNSKRKAVDMPLQINESKKKIGNQRKSLVEGISKKPSQAQFDLDILSKNIPKPNVEVIKQEAQNEDNRPLQNYPSQSQIKGRKISKDEPKVRGSPEITEERRFEKDDLSKYDLPRQIQTKQPLKPILKAGKQKYSPVRNASARKQIVEMIEHQNQEENVPVFGSQNSKSQFIVTFNKNAQANQRQAQTRTRGDSIDLPFAIQRQPSQRTRDAQTDSENNRITQIRSPRRSCASRNDGPERGRLRRSKTPQPSGLQKFCLKKQIKRVEFEDYAAIRSKDLIDHFVKSKSQSPSLAADQKKIGDKNLLLKQDARSRSSSPPAKKLKQQDSRKSRSNERAEKVSVSKSRSRSAGHSQRRAAPSNSFSKIDNIVRENLKKQKQMDQQRQEAQQRHIQILKEKQNQLKIQNAQIRQSNATKSRRNDKQSSPISPREPHERHSSSRSPILEQRKAPVLQLNKDLKTGKDNFGQDAEDQVKKPSERVMRLGLEIFEHQKRGKSARKTNEIQTHRAKIQHQEDQQQKINQLKLQNNRFTTIEANQNRIESQRQMEKPDKYGRPKTQRGNSKKLRANLVNLVKSQIQRWQDAEKQRKISSQLERQRVQDNLKKLERDIMKRKKRENRSKSVNKAQHQRGPKSSENQFPKGKQRQGSLKRSQKSRSRTPDIANRQQRRRLDDQSKRAPSRRKRDKSSRSAHKSSDGQQDEAAASPGAEPIEEPQVLDRKLSPHPKSVSKPNSRVQVKGVSPARHSRSRSPTRPGSTSRSRSPLRSKSPMKHRSITPARDPVRHDKVQQIIKNQLILLGRGQKDKQPSANQNSLKSLALNLLNINEQKLKYERQIRVRGPKKPPSDVQNQPTTSAQHETATKSYLVPLQLQVKPTHDQNQDLKNLQPKINKASSQSQKPMDIIHRNTLTEENVQLDIPLQIFEPKREPRKELAIELDDEILKLVLNAAASIIQKRFRRHLERVKKQQRDEQEEETEWRIRPYHSPQKKVEIELIKKQIEKSSPEQKIEINKSDSPKIQRKTQFEIAENDSIVDIQNQEDRASTVIIAKDSERDLGKKPSSPAGDLQPSMMSSHADQFGDNGNYDALQMMEKIDLEDKIDEIEDDHVNLKGDDPKQQEELDSILNKYSMSNELIVFNDIQSSHKNRRSENMNSLAHSQEDQDDDQLKHLGSPSVDIKQIDTSGGLAIEMPIEIVDDQEHFGEVQKIDQGLEDGIGDQLGENLGNVGLDRKRNQNSFDQSQQSAEITLKSIEQLIDDMGAQQMDFGLNMQQMSQSSGILADVEDMHQDKLVEEVEDMQQPPRKRVPDLPLQQKSIKETNRNPESSSPELGAMHSPNDDNLQSFSSQEADSQSESPSDGQSIQSVQSSIQQNQNQEKDVAPYLNSSGKSGDTEKNLQEDLEVFKESFDKKVQMLEHEMQEQRQDPYRGHTRHEKSKDVEALHGGDEMENGDDGSGQDMGAKQSGRKILDQRRHSASSNEFYQNLKHFARVKSESSHGLDKDNSINHHDQKSSRQASQHFEAEFGLPDQSEGSKLELVNPEKQHSKKSSEQLSNQLRSQRQPNNLSHHLLSQLIRDSQLDRQDRGTIDYPLQMKSSKSNSSLYHTMPHPNSHPQSNRHARVSNHASKSVPRRNLYDYANERYPSESLKSQNEAQKWQMQQSIKSMSSLQKETIEIIQKVNLHVKNIKENLNLSKGKLSKNDEAKSPSNQDQISQDPAALQNMQMNSSDDSQVIEVAASQDKIDTVKSSPPAQDESKSSEKSLEASQEKNKEGVEVHDNENRDLTLDVEQIEVKLEADEPAKESQVKDQQEEIKKETGIEMDKLVALIEKQVITGLVESEIQYLLDDIIKRDEPKETTDNEVPQANSPRIVQAKEEEKEEKEENQIAKDNNDAHADKEANDEMKALKEILSKESREKQAKDDEQKSNSDLNGQQTKIQAEKSNQDDEQKSQSSAASQVISPKAAALQQSDIMPAQISLKQAQIQQELDELQQLQKKEQQQQLIAGIDTSIETVESYIEDIFTQIRERGPQFLNAFLTPIYKDPLEHLALLQKAQLEYQMNGTLRNNQLLDDHCQNLNSSFMCILNVQLYLTLEKERESVIKEAIEQIKMQSQEEIDEEELTEMISEADHIHNKAIFDSVNEAMNSVRPYGAAGEPMPWSKVPRKNVFSVVEDGNIESVHMVLDRVLGQVKDQVIQWANARVGALNGDMSFGHYKQGSNELQQLLQDHQKQKCIEDIINQELQMSDDPQWQGPNDNFVAQVKLELADKLTDQLVNEVVDILNDIEKQR